MKGGEGRRQGILTLKPHCPFCAKGFDWKSCNSHSGVTSAVREIGVGGLCLLAQAASFAYWRKQVPMPIGASSFLCLLAQAGSYAYWRK